MVMNKKAFLITECGNLDLDNKFLCADNKKSAAEYLKDYSFTSAQSYEILEKAKKFTVPSYMDFGFIDIIETIDDDNETVLLDGFENQIMMQWEKPYMEECIDKLSPVGDVLEFGFGLGYSAERIIQHPIDSYTVIESDPSIVKKAREWKKHHPDKKINIVPGKWQDIFFSLGQFDCLFFDTAEYVKPPEDMALIFTLFPNLKNEFKYSCYRADSSADLDFNKNLTFTVPGEIDIDVNNDVKGIYIQYFYESSAYIPRKKCRYIHKDQKIYVFVLSGNKENIIRSIMSKQQVLE